MLRYLSDLSSCNTRGMLCCFYYLTLSMLRSRAHLWPGAAKARSALLPRPVMCERGPCLATGRSAPIKCRIMVSLVRTPPASNPARAASARDKTNTRAPRRGNVAAPRRASWCCVVWWCFGARIDGWLGMAPRATRPRTFPRARSGPSRLQERRPTT